MQPTSLGLLQALYASDNQPFFMTASEGSELASLGYIQVDPGTTSPENPAAFRVAITQSGINALQNQQQPAPAAFPGVMTPQAPQAPQSFAPPAPPVQQSAPQAAPQTKASFSLDSGVSIPKITRGNSGNLTPRESVYPFDIMEIDQSFHVPATAADPEPHKRMASNVSAANRRFEEEIVPQVMETVTRKRLVKDASGNFVVDPTTGKKVYEEYTETVAKTRPTRRFIARRVDAKDPNGPGVRVFRVGLDYA